MSREQKYKFRAYSKNLNQLRLPLEIRVLKNKFKIKNKYLGMSKLDVT